MFGFRGALVVGMGLVAMLAACGDGDGDGDGGTETPGAADDTATPSAADDTATPSAEDEIAAQLWTDFSQSDAYLSWSTVPEGLSNPDDLALSETHNSLYVLAYSNDVAAAALASWDGEMPQGGTLVKAMYSDDTGQTLKGFTVMAKVEGYTSDSNDWFWARYDPTGAVVGAGQIDTCVSCHAASENDYIQTAF